MEHVDYDGPLWDGQRLAPALRDLLARRDTLVELRHEGAGGNVVLGVPHHAAPGVDRIAERRPGGGRVADENAVLYALLGFERLRALGRACRVLVAAHATDHDPNKNAESPYCRQALADGGRLLVECHGAGLRAPHDLELTAGTNEQSEPLRFGRLLADALGEGFHVATQTAPGSRAALLLDARGGDRGTGVLRFPALRTRSLTAAGARGLHALHLEAKPRFRSRGDGTGGPTEAGRRLGAALASAVDGYLPAS